MFLFLMSFVSAIPMKIMIRPFAHNKFLGKLDYTSKIQLVNKENAGIYQIDPTGEGITYIQDTKDLTFLTKMYTHLTYEAKGLNLIIPRDQGFSINLLGNNIFAIEINNECLEIRGGFLYFEQCEYKPEQKFAIIHLNEKFAQPDINTNL